LRGPWHPTPLGRDRRGRAAAVAARGMGAGADWKYIFEDPPEGYRLIAPDLRGHGATANPSGAFTFRQCALDVLALVRHLGIPRIKAIGLSGGGITLLHAATLQPSAVESMVVISAPPYFRPEGSVTMPPVPETAICACEP